MAYPSLPPRFAPKGQILRAAQLFGGVAPALVHSLAVHAEHVVLGRGDVLWGSGDPAHAFHIVAFGALKLQSRPSPRPIITSFVLPGESAADAIVVACDRMPTAAVAQSAVVEVLRIPAEPVLAAAKRDASLADALQRSVAREVRWLHTKIEIVTMGSVAERLSTFVLRLVERFPRRGDGPLVLPFAPSRVELASVVEARAETITRELGKLTHEGVFTVGRESIVVHDLEALRRRVSTEDTALPPAASRVAPNALSACILHQ